MKEADHVQFERKIILDRHFNLSCKKERKERNRNET